MDRKRRILPTINPEQRIPLIRRILIVGQSLAILIACMVAAATMGGKWLPSLTNSLITSANHAAVNAGLQVRYVLTPNLDDKQRQAVIAASGIKTGTSMFAADPHKIRRQIENIDQIGSAHVTRIWPEIILITVKPRSAAALSNNGSTWAVLDHNGYVIAGINPEQHKSLVRMFGTNNPQTAAELIRVLEQHPTTRKHLRLAERIGKRRWNLHLTSGARLILPEKNWIQHLTRIETLHHTYGLFDLNINQIDARIARIITLTLPDDPALTEIRQQGS